MMICMYSLWCSVGYSSVIRKFVLQGLVKIGTRVMETIGTKDMATMDTITKATEDMVAMTILDTTMDMVTTPVCNTMYDSTLN